MIDRDLQTLPNYLCLLRLFMVPVLLLLAWHGHHQAFILIMLLAFLLDAIDGPIARYLQQMSELGPYLDTAADVCIYLSLPIGIWWLWPELVRAEWLYFLLIVLSIVAPMAAGFIKFRRPTGYHTWLARAAVVVTAMATFVLLLQGPALPFRIASFVCLAAGLEEIIITLLLEKPRSDVRTFMYVMRNR